MTLLERIRANRCAVVDCQRERMADAAVCRDHMGDLWGNRLDRLEDGTYQVRRTFAARDESWLGRAA